MPIPVVVWAIVEIAAAALTAYEAYDALSELYEGLDGYKKNLDEAKKSLEKIIEKLKAEIDLKIEEKEEVPILLAAAAGDRLGQVTRRAAGRGAGNPLINTAIEQKIPFRKIISMVCEKADSLPMLQLRKKTGNSLKPQDVAKIKSKILKELVQRGVEAGTDIKDLDAFILVRLKQLTADLLFEFIDYAIDWKSPLKCEVSFGPKPGYSDHPVDDSSTKLKRVGKINPFYPNPPPNNRKGSISADLIIPDYRKKRCNKNNIFAIVEIKFQNDRIEEEQFKNYEKLLDTASQVKTAGHAIRYANKPVSSGGRLSLFRYPEDKWPDKDDEQDKKKSTQKTGKKKQK